MVIVVMAGVLAHAGTLGRTAGGQTQGEEIRRWLQWSKMAAHVVPGMYIIYTSPLPAYKV